MGLFTSKLPMREETLFGVVHCSATPPSMDIGRTEIDHWHREKGWAKIGYHWVIRRDGSLEAGRGPDEVGAHVVGWNHCSIAVCLVGGTDAKGAAQRNFTDAQYTALKTLLDEWTHTYPGITIQGHRDFPNIHKDCPSFDVKIWLRDGGQK